MASGLEDLMAMIQGLKGGGGGQPMMPAEDMRRQMMEQMLNGSDLRSALGAPRPGPEFYSTTSKLGPVSRANRMPSTQDQPKPIKNPGQLPRKYGPPSLAGQPKPKRRVKNLNKPGEGGLPKRKKKSDKQEVADQVDD